MQPASPWTRIPGCPAANLPFARELWNEDAADSMPLVRVPTLVIIGGEDLQVDPRIDGGLLQEAASELRNVTLAFPANANHQLKEETRSTSEIAASGELRNNDPDAQLDPDTAALILSWLAGVLSDHAADPGLV